MDPRSLSVPRNARRTRTLTAASLSLLLLFQACTRWTVETRPVADVIAAGDVASFRVHPKEGEPFMLYRPEVIGDSLAGYLRPAVFKDLTITTLPLAAIDRIETEHVDGGRTGMLTLTLVLAVAIVYVAVASSFNPGVCSGGCSY